MFSMVRKDKVLLECLREYTVHMLLVFYLVIRTATSDDKKGGFSFSGNLKLGDVASIPPGGLFTLNNKSSPEIGHAFYSTPLNFKNSSSNGKSLSFSTTFVFAILPEGPIGGHGIAFVISPFKDMPGAFPSSFLGLFNSTNNGDPSNHVVAIELDTVLNPQFNDINDNHVGIDINGLTSVVSEPAAYFTENGERINITLASRKKIQVWVDYDAVKEKINVTLSPLGINKPQKPLLSYDIDISSIILDKMYVGFSSSTGTLKQEAYVLGWSFQLDGKAELDLSTLPSLPNTDGNNKSKVKAFVIPLVLSLTGLVLVSIAIFVIFLLCKRRKRKKGEAELGEILEDWEVQYGPHRFRYKDLYLATKGFDQNNLLGKGGFGQVYKGVVPSSNIQIAVKKISHGSKQGMKEFIAEIATIGRLRHPNLVRLLGYCRREGELLLVYDFMPNTSLDKFIFSNIKSGEPFVTLNWQQRFKIINQVACGLAYLHEEWVEVIVHRDIKASNVLLDGELNAKLGDFGLARCINHAQDAQTTNLAGTLGYIAPELAKNGKATTRTDVFAFGAFCLEVACGRRPLNLSASTEQSVLVDFALECWKKGELLKTLDSRIIEKSEAMVKQMELVLKVSLLCSHNVAVLRPKMSQVVQYFSGRAELPENLEALLLLAREQCIEDFDTVLHGNDSGKALTISQPFIGR